ncbi:GntR family transcriptional regulator [Streptomyces sp. MB09-02B]|uniref:winged helix-turn-helix domain-containing protein n=1 Tax=Streptomyces sp. MB09-02B TaxID=3028667 RepID=UPI0029AB3235|nr:GntR family transcriptional regulator [Streptomyces sp. MB09-02B]MDX3644167.1 GntR family transcriptional regulator [Streptomyces sp. MB09-02B]
MGDARTSEGGGAKFERVLEALRARIADGTYPVGVSLPPQRQLREELEVSRDTVQRVLARLSEEGWVESRRGSGTRVLGAQRVQSQPGSRVTLRSFFDHAFAQREVALDIFTLSSESLSAHVQLQAERIRDREVTPRSIVLRMLLPTESTHLPYPTVRNDPEDMRPQQRLRETTRTHKGLLKKALDDLKRAGDVPQVEVSVRHVRLAPPFKLYLLNRTEALHGFYEVLKRSIEVGGGEEVAALDVLGLGATLTYHVKESGPSSQGSNFVVGAQAWFDSVWSLLTDEGS